MIFPFEGDSVRVTSPFGRRILGGKADNHTGYDLVGVGTRNVTAAVAGSVVRSRIVTDRSDPTWQWGNYVCIRTAAGQQPMTPERARQIAQAARRGEKIPL